MDNKPLSKVRVLEVGAYISAPYAGALLQALGAEVIKVESPEGDAFRRGAGVDSDYFTQYNAGKKSISINLKSAEGIALIKDLLPQFDVLIENMRPGKMDALGLSAEDCQKINTRLIYASISGFGRNGPLVDRPAYDTMGQSYGGIYSIMNDEGSARLTGTCVGDLITGVSAAMGVLAALLGREHSTTNQGMRVETSLLEAMSLLTVDSITQALETKSNPIRTSRHSQAQNFCFNTQSGGAITVHLSSSEKFWRSLANAIGRNDLLEDARFSHYSTRSTPSNFALLNEILAHEFLRHSREEWEVRLTESDVPFAPVLTMHEVINHPQTKSLDLLETEPGGRCLVRPPWRFNEHRPTRADAPPHIGQDTLAVLSEIRTQDQLNALLASGTVRNHVSPSMAAVEGYAS